MQTQKNKHICEELENQQRGGNEEVRSEQWRSEKQTIFLSVFCYEAEEKTSIRWNETHRSGRIGRWIQSHFETIFLMNELEKKNGVLCPSHYEEDLL